MKRVYTALNSIDAHIVRGLLEQHGLSVIIEGEYLLGGIGELPPSGLISVRVADECVDFALSLVRDYEDNITGD